MRLVTRFKRVLIGLLLLLFSIGEARPEETVRICLGNQCPDAPVNTYFINFPCEFGRRWKLGWLREALKQACPDGDVISEYPISPYFGNAADYDHDNPRCSPQVHEARCKRVYPGLSHKVQLQQDRSGERAEPFHRCEGISCGPEYACVNNGRENRFSYCKPRCKTDADCSAYPGLRCFDHNNTTVNPSKVCNNFPSGFVWQFPCGPARPREPIDCSAGDLPRHECAASTCPPPRR
jgi:hypothetical protein